MFNDDLEKMDKYFEFRSQPILDWATKACKAGGVDLDKDCPSSRWVVNSTESPFLGVVSP
jgi:hypothetical protein